MLCHGAASLKVAEAGGVHDEMTVVVHQTRWLLIG